MITEPSVHDLSTPGNSLDAYPFDGERSGASRKTRRVGRRLTFAEGEQERCGKDVARSRGIDGEGRIGGYVECFPFPVEARASGTFGHREEATGERAYELIGPRRVVAAHRHDIDVREHPRRRGPSPRSDRAFLVPVAEETLGGQPAQAFRAETDEGCLDLACDGTVENRGAGIESAVEPLEVLRRERVCAGKKTLAPGLIVIDVLEGSAFLSVARVDLDPVERSEVEFLADRGYHRRGQPQSRRGEAGVRGCSAEQRLAASMVDRQMAHGDKVDGRVTGTVDLHGAQDKRSTSPLASEPSDLIAARRL